jgi:hypothetical protein
MDGTADRSESKFNPLTLTLSLGERGYSGERKYTGGREMPAQARYLRPIVLNPQPPSPFPPCHAVPTGPGARRLPVGASQ